MAKLMMICLIASAALIPLPFANGDLQSEQPQPAQDHVAWVGQTLLKMQTIKPGMTRKQLLSVFMIEGGISSTLRRTFVSQNCPYFKVDVEFRTNGRPDRDSEGRETSVEDPEDVIVKISRPYLDFTHAD